MLYPEQFTVHCSTKEKKIIKSLAKKAGTSVSRYLVESVSKK